MVFLCSSVGCDFFGLVLALVTRTRHLHKFVRGGDNRRGGRLRPRSFLRRRDGRVPGRMLLTEPGDATAASKKRRPTYGGCRDFSGRLSRSGRCEGTKAPWAHAAHKRGMDDRDRLCRRDKAARKNRGNPAAGRKASIIARVWEVRDGYGWVLG